jgi:hypothetical protein
MRRSTVIGIRVGYVLLIVVLVWLPYRAFRRAKSRSGPTPRMIIESHLWAIQVDKAILRDQCDLSDDYWPTRAQIILLETGRTNRSFDSLYPPSSWGEVYIVNSIGSPAYAYLSNAVGGFPAGYQLTLEDFDPYRSKTVQRTGVNPLAQETKSASSPVDSPR